jgi:ATP-binding cassette subfamily B protein
LSIPAGSNAAFAGKSGAGKSTIVNLLLRFFDPQTGAILIDGTDIRSYDIQSWQKQIAVVFQDTYLFYGTVSENLRMAKQNAAQQELERAAVLAGAHGFISALPSGYETLIGERGARLSGGERQRIAIARAILKDAPILVFDEATSNVDAASERVIQEGLSQLMKGRTTLAIAHRLSTIQDAAQIFVLADGRIVEQETAEALWAHDGAYRELVHAQKTQGNVGL